MPRVLAPATSMVLYPAPARTMSDSRPASSMGAVTFVPRTTSTSAPVEAIACARESSLRSGSYTTSHPAAFSPSTPLFSNLSAMRTFMPSTRSAASALDGVDEKPVAQLGLEPRGLRRHDAPFVRDRHQVVDGHGVHREGH